MATSSNGNIRQNENCPTYVSYAEIRTRTPAHSQGLHCMHIPPKLHSMHEQPTLQNCNFKGQAACVDSLTSVVAQWVEPRSRGILIFATVPHGYLVLRERGNYGEGGIHGNFGAVAVTAADFSESSRFRLPRVTNGGPGTGTDFPDSRKIIKKLSKDRFWGIPEGPRKIIKKLSKYSKSVIWEGPRKIIKKMSTGGSTLSKKYQNIVPGHFFDNILIIFW